MKILKNTTASDIDLTKHGRIVPALGELEVESTEYGLLASEDVVNELEPYILSGDIVVNDGTNDLDSDIGIEYIKYPDNAESILVDLTTTNLVGRNLQEALESISQGTGIPSISNVVYVAKNGDNLTANGFFSKPFLTVEAAINHINTNLSPSSTNPIAISVSPGLYQENKLTIPEWVVVVGYGPRSRIEAIDPNDDLMICGENTSIRSLSFQGVTDNSKYLLKFSNNGGGVASATDVLFQSASNGLFLENTGSGLFAVTVSGVLSASVTNEVVGVGNGSRLTLNTISINGNSTTTKALVQYGNGVLLSYIARVSNCAVGLQINGDIGSILLTSASILDTTNVLIQSGNSELEVLGGNFDASTAVVSNLNVISGYYFNEVVGEKRLSVIGELAVGQAGNGRESALGEGDSYYNGSLVFEYDGSTYTNVSTSSRNPLSGSFGIPNTNTNSAIYVSTAFPDKDQNYQTFSGIKVEVTTAAVLGSGEIVAEYWDGSSWVEFNHMSEGEAGVNYTKYAKDCLTRAVSEQILFDDDILSDWQTSDPVSLGINLYWVRFRIISNITTAPILNTIKIHSNRTEINSDGFVQYFGKARRVKTLNSDVRFEAAINSPTNQDVFLSDNLAVGKVENEYFDASLLSNSDQSASVFKIPSDMDTSCKMRFKVYFTANDTGTVVMNCYWNYSRTGNVIYQTSGSAPSTSSGEQVVVLSKFYPVANRQGILEYELDVSDIVPRDSNGDSDLLWLGLRINNTTTVEPVVVINATLDYVSNESGGHL